MVPCFVVLPKRAHLAERELESFLRGELNHAERRRVVRHLLAGCPECQAIGRSLWALGDQPLIPGHSFRTTSAR